MGVTTILAVLLVLAAGLQIAGRVVNNWSMQTASRWLFVFSILLTLMVFNTINHM